jgi:hypothetical protein
MLPMSQSHTQNADILQGLDALPPLLLQRLRGRNALPDSRSQQNTQRAIKVVALSGMADGKRDEQVSIP